MSRLETLIKRGIAILIAAVLFGATVIISIEEFINEYETGTIVGDIDLSGKKKNSVNSDIILGATDHISDFYISVEFNNKSYTLSSEIVSFNLTTTVQNVSNGERSLIYYDIDRTLLDSELEENIDSKFIELIDVDAIEAIIARSLLDNDPFASIDLHDHIEDLTVLWEPLNSYTFIDLSGENVLKNIESGTMIIEANSKFSFLNNTHDMFLNNEELSILATGIQAVTIDTNFESFTKSSHKNQSFDENNDYDIYDTYINIAQKKDFSFYNPFNFTYQIEFIKTGETIVFTLSGIEYDQVYTHKVKTEIVEFITVSGDIPTTGRDGILYEITRYIERDDILLLDQYLYTNFYPAVNEVQ
jgi:hypothetical protein